MNQRLLVILAVLLLIVGAFGLLMNSGPPPQSSAPEPLMQVSYFVSEKILPTGSLLRDEDFVIKTEFLPADSREATEESPESLRGMFLVTDKAPGERISPADVSVDDPKNKLAAANMIRYNIVVNEEFTGALQQLRAGDYVDVYLRFSSENTKARRKNSESLLYGESSLSFFRIFESRRVISRPEKAAPSLLERKSLIESGNKGEVTGSLSLDLELSPADLKRLYRVTRKYDIILFPGGTGNVQRKTLSEQQGAAK
ncbi:MULTISPECIES: hypothetical protein [unclassified Tatumella]|uniref:hypothetical protein n=1 Tax=unclassified Tatumella TaxID=2649542 RepID=UPI001BB0B1CF|nr:MULTISPECIES: hypothetical protein [unclassified Tatumella]MBS0876995.1 hypothetical protein [Tatumella sp. JGM82]MBS0890868.1 hypothetical protein [Tatumella sp. JGM94]MBS0901887.1 hypothetical protein [Tatumella sp. JGM100]